MFFSNPPPREHREMRSPTRLMDDLQLARRLRRLGRIRTVQASVTVSGRRFLARPLYSTLLVNVFPLPLRLCVYGDPR